jgi:hypothetical protein
MSEKPDSGKPARGPKSSQSGQARLERQAAALRENLRRRNAQRRGRASGEPDSEPSGNGS